MAYWSFLKVTCVPLYFTPVTWHIILYPSNVIYWFILGFQFFGCVNVHALMSHGWELSLILICLFWILGLHSNITEGREKLSCLSSPTVKCRIGSISLALALFRLKTVGCFWHLLELPGYCNRVITHQDGEQTAKWWWEPWGVDSPALSWLPLDILNF